MMSPHVHPGDSKFGIWWRRWVGTIALAAVVVVGGIGFAKVESEGHTRETQFCGLTISNFKEKEDRISQTKDFLGIPDSQLPQSLVDLKRYIRTVSLPLTIKEFRSEEKNIPDICLKYFNDGGES